MRRLLRSKKGLTFVEVLISLTILGLLAVPIMMMFMNAQRYARKVDKQTEINAVTRTVKQLVSEGLISDAPLKDINDDYVDINEDGRPEDGFKDIVRHANEISAPVTTPYLQIIEGSEVNEKYTYKVKYDPEKYYDPNYFGVYNVLITIVEKETTNTVNEIKVSVNVGEEIGIIEDESEELEDDED